MKRKLLSLLVLLLMAVTGAWADNLYLEVSGTSATLEYGTPGDNPYYTGSGWDSTDDGTGASTAQSNVTTITVGTSCKNFTGTSLLYLFGNFGKLTSINNIGNLNTTNVTDMRAMFHTCGALTTLDLNSLNTASVTTMKFMFNTCPALTTLDIRNWDTANVTDMTEMFKECRKLKAIYVGNNWKTGNVINSKDMFYACSNLPNWDEEKIDKTRANTGADGYLNKVKVTANLANGAYWSTFYSNAYNHQAPEGTQVFAVNLNTSKAEITMTEIPNRIALSGKGVVLKQTTGSSDPTTTITMALTETAPDGDFSGNSLEGTMTEINTTGTNDYYVLNYTTANGVGFYKLSNTSGTIEANKAYLTYDGKAGARGFFGLDDNNGTTGIEMPVVEGNDNADTVVYDLQGRRVLNPTKGLYIVNGKKVVIK